MPESMGRDTDMKKVRWGLVGLGSIAERQLVPAINESEDSRLVALCSRSELKAREWVSRFGATKAYDEYSMMIRTGQRCQL